MPTSRSTNPTTITSRSNYCPKNATSVPTINALQYTSPLSHHLPLTPRSSSHGGPCIAVGGGIPRPQLTAVHMGVVDVSLSPSPVKTRYHMYAPNRRASVDPALFSTKPILDPHPCPSPEVHLRPPPRSVPTDFPGGVTTNCTRGGNLPHCYT